MNRSTPGSSITPRPTRTIGPAATPAASIVYTTTDSIFTLKVPANWIVRSGKQQLVSNRSQQMDYVAVSAPGTAPQPAILIYYHWPAAGSITNDDAWQQAYALAALTIKVCPVTLTTGNSITIGGETGKYIGYIDSCQVQGELIGLVHHNVNFGMLLEAPESLWPTWRPILRDIMASLAFEQ